MPVTATIQTVIEPVSVTVIFADQNAPRPPYPYATIRAQEARKIGWDEIREMDADNIATIGGQRVATVLVNYFGTKPIEELSKMVNALEKKTILEALAADGLSILQKNPVQNATAMLETKFEEHSFFDFTAGFAENVEDDLGVIETAELTGVYKDAKTGEIVVGPQIIGV